MVELRKRKAPAEPARTDGKETKVLGKPPKRRSVESRTVTTDDSPSQNTIVKVDDVLTLDGFGGKFETNEGEKTTLKSLVDTSKAGVVLFTYPKASTPGCTKQACMFRDGYDHLTSTGLSIFGLSTDSPKANTTFKTKQNLPYPLLCDPEATLIGALGFKKTPKGTTRGVCVVDKIGKIRLLERGSPASTVDAVQALVAKDSKADAPEEPEE